MAFFSAPPALNQACAALSPAPPAFLLSRSARAISLLNPKAAIIVVRKSAHVIEYGVLAALSLRWFRSLSALPGAGPGSPPYSSAPPMRLPMRLTRPPSPGESDPLSMSCSMSPERPRLGPPCAGEEGAR